MTYTTKDYALCVLGMTENDYNNLAKTFKNSNPIYPTTQSMGWSYNSQCLGKTDTDI